MAFWTAASTSVAVLVKVSVNKQIEEGEGGKTYLACSVAKPLWTAIEGSIPGKRVPSRGAGIKLMSVMSGTLWGGGHGMHE